MTDIQSAACLISVLLCFLIGQKLPFKQLSKDKQSQHLVFASTVCLFLLWMFQTGIAGSPTVHFLWLAALPLVLGFRWAICSTLIALLALTLLGIESYEMLGVNFLFGCLAPIALTYGIYSLTFHKLPKNVFVYIFVCAFIPGALTIGLKMLLLSGYFYLDGLYSWQHIMDNYLMLTTLLAFPEAMFNGMTITLLIIYKPHWVYTFYDKFYLSKK
tara:strand:- start:11 stop:655 length:645 start_codon:yes stop_codon:yes gene_type:complete